MTPKQQAFVAEYLIDKNATQAAIRAGYSAKTAEWIGHQLLKKTHVKVAVDEGLAKHAEKAGLSAELVFASLARELKFDPAELYDADGNIKPIHEMPADARKCLVGMETVQMGGPDSPVMVQKVRWVNPTQAREQAMKHLGMFEKDNEQQKTPLIGVVRLVPLE